MFLLLIWLQPVFVANGHYQLRDVIPLIHTFVVGIAVFVQWIKYLDVRNDVTLAGEVFSV